LYDGTDLTTANCGLKLGTLRKTNPEMSRNEIYVNKEEYKNIKTNELPILTSQ